MKTSKIIEVVGLCRNRFEDEGIPKMRTSLDRPFVSRKDTLMHAHYLCDGVIEYAKNPTKKGKTGRHLGSLQTLLMVAGWYTLREIMNHNKPSK